jgi:hypothetical protein
VAQAVDVCLATARPVQTQYHHPEKIKGNFKNKNELDIMVHTCNLNTWDAKTRDKDNRSEPQAPSSAFI